MELIKLGFECPKCKKEFETNQWDSEEKEVVLKCDCGLRNLNTSLAIKNLRPNILLVLGRRYVSLFFGMINPDWMGFYGSPDSKDEDIALIFFREIPVWVKENWEILRKWVVSITTCSSMKGIDPIAVSVKNGAVNEILGADPDWPHPKEDVQNCLYQTVPAVPELADRINYISPDKRNIEEKIIQCRAWLDYFSRNPVDAKTRKPPYEIWDLWAKRAGFIGIQLLALKQGQDAGYTKKSVREWAEKNIKMLRKPLPPTDHPARDHHHDLSETRNFLQAVLNDSETEFRLITNCPDIDCDGRVSFDRNRWEPYAPIFKPLKIKTVKEDLGVCPLCGSGISSDEPICPTQIFYSKVFVHPVCAKGVAERLIDLSDGNCHLEFDKDGVPFWVWGECFSSSRIEYSVWDKDWNLVEKSDCGPDHPLGV